MALKISVLTFFGATFCETHTLFGASFAKKLKKFWERAGISIPLFLLIYYHLHIVWRTVFHFAVYATDVFADDSNRHYYY